MLTMHELSGLIRDLATTPVLSVYLDVRVTDPAMRHAWRQELLNALRTARAEISRPEELERFDRAAALLDKPLPESGAGWSAPGWVAFLTADGPRYVSDLPVRVPTRVAWRNGPVVSPYLRVLKQHVPVAIAVVDSQSARIFRYAKGRLMAVEPLHVPKDETHGPSESPSSDRRGKSMPAARGAVSTEAVQRRREVEFVRLAGTLASRLSEIAGDDGWVLIGGTTHWARLAAGALPSALTARTMVSPALDHDAPEDVISAAATEAASALRADKGRAVIGRLLEHAGPMGRGAAGVPATQRALRARAVDLLLISPSFVELHEPDAESMVRAALEQGSDVEVLSGEQGAYLDRTADGIAARLRFAIDAAPVMAEERPAPELPAA